MVALVMVFQPDDMMPSVCMVWCASDGTEARFRSVLHSRTPVVLRNTPCDAWRAAQLWRLGDGAAYLREHVPSLSNVYQLKTKRFHYRDASRPLGGEAARPTQNLTLAKFLAQLHADEGAVAYYTRSIPKSDFARVAHDVEANVFPAQCSGEPIDFDTDIFTQVWMAPAGFVTHMHYDIYDNFYLQVDGTKQFDLALAASHTLLHLYPITHQRTRLVQVPLEDDAAREAWHPTEPIFLLRARLQPGDLLFLPAFTFHQVKALTPSLSVNVFRPSHSSVAKRRLRDLGLPAAVFRPAPEEKAFATAALVTLLQRFVHKALNVRPEIAVEWVQEVLFQSRYQHASGVACSPFEESACPHLRPLLDERLLAQVITFADRQAEVVHHLAGLEAAEAKSLPGSPSGFQAYIRGLVEIIVADHVEDMISVVVGADRVCVYLQCFVARWPWLLGKV